MVFCLWKRGEREAKTHEVVDITLATWSVNYVVHLKYLSLQALISKAHFSHTFKPSIARGQQKSSRHWVWRVGFVREHLKAESPQF